MAEPKVLLEALGSGAADLESAIAGAMERVPIEPPGPGSRERNSNGTLTGVLIEDGKNKFRIEALLTRTNHADVYCVTSLTSDAQCLEARAYNLINIPKHLRQYRARNMRRMSSRKVLRTKWQHLEVVLYRPGDIGKPDDTPPLREVDTLSTSGDSAREEVEEKRKTECQRKSARLRQSERRKSERLARQGAAQTNQDGASDADDTSKDGGTIPRDDEVVITQLFRTHFSPVDLSRPDITPTTRVQATGYLEAQEYTFANDSDLEDFTNIKLQDVVYLQQLQDRLPIIEDAWKTVCLWITWGHPKSSSNEWLRTQQRFATEAALRLSTVRSIQLLIPGIIADAKNKHHQLKERLALAKQEREDLDELE